MSCLHVDERWVRVGHDQCRPLANPAPGQGSSSCRQTSLLFLAPVSGRPQSTAVYYVSSSKIDPGENAVCKPALTVLNGRGLPSWANVVT